MKNSDKIMHYLQKTANKKKSEVKVLKNTKGWRNIKTSGVHVHVKSVKTIKEDLICCTLE